MDILNSLKRRQKLLSNWTRMDESEQTTPVHSKAAGNYPCISSFRGLLVFLQANARCFNKFVAQEHSTTAKGSNYEQAIF
jgi:hypothetical protein